ncbi:MAG: hypothetical protein COA79_18565 [Planctomycetota bacterium]|nr:MAG: hypothetical protein COA79_18565 [Planctomycetota bacterium]
MAYSPKHKKIVAVQDTTTWIYDITKEVWKKACTDEKNHAHDSFSVFDYDSKNDVFLLLGRTEGGRKGAASPFVLRAYNITENKWKTLTVGGSGLPSSKGKMGYYDPVFDAFVLYAENKNRVWLYRYGQEEDKK